MVLMIVVTVSVMMNGITHHMRRRIINVTPVVISWKRLTTTGPNIPDSVLEFIAKNGGRREPPFFFQKK
jgi:ABC-type lipoprotein release transport system permease subunit